MGKKPDVPSLGTILSGLPCTSRTSALVEPNPNVRLLEVLSSGMSRMPFLLSHRSTLQLASNITLAVS